MHGSRHSLRRSTRLATLLCLAALVAASSGTGHAQGASSCSKYASPTGSDSSAGTATAPFGTAQKLVGTLTAGQTGCLLGGAYSGNITFTASGAAGSPVTLTTAPGYTQATIRGVVSVTATASYVTLDNLKVDTTNASQLVAVQLFGDNGRLTNSDVFGGDQTGRIGVQVGYSKVVKNVEIDGNRIHNFGSAGRIYDQGIYIDLADGTLVHDNYIYDNAGGFGIQLWTSSQRGHIYNNTIDGNGAGSIIIAGQLIGSTAPSSYNEIDHNILSNAVSGKNTVVFWGNYSSSSANAGRGNNVRDNVSWQGSLDAGSAYGANAGVAYASNSSVDPQYVDRTSKTFTLRAGSPAAGFGANAVVAISPSSTAPPTIAGSPAIGQALVASNGTWTGSPSSFIYAWQRCNVAGSTCTAISAATASAYVVASADAGSSLRVSVTATSTGGTATAVSAPTAAVPVPTATSSIREGAILSGVVRWTATAPAGTTSVEFWVDGVRLAVQTAAPYGYDLRTASYLNGAHLVGIAWTDSSGVRHPASPATNVSFQNLTTSSIAEGAILTGVVRWTATVPADAKSVEFWVDGARRAIRNSTPCAYDLDTRTYANGAHIVGIAWTNRSGTRHPASPVTQVTFKN
jgi:parallel beta helix pectate lyase-like protein/Big-like domain-containing protein